MAFLGAPDSVIQKRQDHPLNDQMVVAANPTCRNRAGYRFKELPMKVWAVSNGHVIGHNDQYGECWAPIDGVRVSFAGNVPEVTSMAMVAREVGKCPTCGNDEMLVGGKLPAHSRNPLDIFGTDCPGSGQHPKPGSVQRKMVDDLYHDRDPSLREMSAPAAGAVKMALQDAGGKSVAVGDDVEGINAYQGKRGKIVSAEEGRLGGSYSVRWSDGTVTDRVPGTYIHKMSASVTCPGCKHSAPVTFGRIEKHLNLNKAVVCAGSGHKVKMGNGGFSVGDKVRHANGVTGTVSGDAASGLLYVKTDDGSGYLGTKIMNPKDLVKMSAPAARGVKMAAGDSTFADIARRHGATSIDETSTGGWLGAKFRDKASADRFADDVASGIGKRPNVSDAPGGFGFWVQVKMSAPASQAVRMATIHEVKTGLITRTGAFYCNDCASNRGLSGERKDGSAKSGARCEGCGKLIPSVASTEFLPRLISESVSESNYPKF